MSKFTSKFFSVVLACVITALMSVMALAQGHPIEGEYTTSAQSAELGTITYVMVVKKSGDKWVCEIKDSPMPLTVSAMTVDADNNVVITADAGGTTVELKGKLVGEKMAGNWSAGDMKGTFEAIKKGAAAAAAAPAPAVASPAAASASAASLEGTYDFKVVAEGQGELPFVIVLKKDGDKYKVEVPNPGDMTVTDVKVDGENVLFNAAYQGNGPIPLNGKVKPGEMGGKWEFSGFSGTWSAKKK